VTGVQTCALPISYRALDRLRSEGSIRAVGAGMNQSEMLVRFAREANFDCFLLAGRYTLLDRSGAAELLPLCAERRIAIIAGGVFNSGILADPRPGATCDYPWMGDELVAIRRPFGPNDLRPLLADNGVEKTILVQTVSSVEETREFLETAAANEFVGGVVGWVDLTSPEVEETIASLVSDLLVGIRHQVHDESDPR